MTVKLSVDFPRARYHTAIGHNSYPFSFSVHTRQYYLLEQKKMVVAQWSDDLLMFVIPMRIVWLYVIS